MNHAMHMHPTWDAIPDPGMRRSSMQSGPIKPSDDGIERSRNNSTGDNTSSPGVAGPEDPDRERRRGGGKRRHRGRHHAGPPMDWNDDSFGQTFGPDRSSRRQRRGRGRRNRGDVRASVLLLLDEQPRHGYEILTELADRSDGSWRPSPGSVYPVLKALSAEGLVHPEQEAGRRVFHLTDEGRKLVEEHRESWGEPWQTESSATTPGLDNLHRDSEQLFGAVRQVVLLNNEPQLRQTAAVLVEARKAIYLMLAEVDSSITAQDVPTTPETRDEKDDS